MTEEYSYIAFISYRHLPLDMQAARKIQKKIENYIIPKDYRRQFGGKKLGRVFRDNDELASTASLSDSICDALDRSEYLVVICTPDFPKSRWCEAEIRYFLKTHGREKLLAVLADGNPVQSFSPYMLHDYDEDGNPVNDFEPLAANIAGPHHTIDQKAFDKEITRIIAAMIGCPFDALWQREKRTRVNRLLRASAAVIAILCLFLGVVLIYNIRILDQNRKIEEMNAELQSRLSTAFVDSGFSKLEDHNAAGALEDALSSFTSDDPAVYDHRVGRLLYDALGAGTKDTLRSTAVYSQSVNIKKIQLTDDKEHVILLDEGGAIRCVSLISNELLWDVRTDDEAAEIYADHLGDRVIYKDGGGVICLSLSDGSVIWEYHNRRENYFQAISDDGTLFAAADQSEDKDEIEIIFLDTSDGSVAGQIDAAGEDGTVPYAFEALDASSFAAAFSSDNSRFVLSLPENGSDSNRIYRFWYVDLNTFEKQLIDSAEHKGFVSFYGADINTVNDTVYLAYLNGKTIRTILYTRSSGHFEALENKVIHAFRSPDGINYNDDYFERTGCRFLSEQGRIYIFSDNQFYVYSREKNRLLNSYALSGSIIHVYWADPASGKLEIVTDDGNIIDYSMSFSDRIINEYDSFQLDQGSVSCVCPAGNGAISEKGSLYTVSGTAPGKLFFVRSESDSNRKILISGNEDGEKISDHFRYAVTDYSETGLLIDEDGDVVSFDKNSGEILKTASFGNTLTLNLLGTDDFRMEFAEQQIIILDADHFVAGDTIYGMDNTAERYTYGGLECPEQSIRTFDGHIFSWANGFPFGYELDKEWADNSFPVGCLRSTNLWLDGTMMEHFSESENTLLFYSDSYDSLLTMVGENGLVLRYGYIVDHPEEETFIKHEEKELAFIDALAEKATIMENAYPESGSFIPVIGHNRKLCAAVYEDGTVCIYNIEKESVSSPENRYLFNEIEAVCFSDDDAFLLVLTTDGRLDIYETDTLSNVFSERIEAFDMDVYFFTTTFLKAGVSGNGKTVFVSYGTGSSDTVCIIIDTEGWEKIGEFIGDSVIFDKDTGKVFSIAPEEETDTNISYSIITYPLYDISTLKKWAERVVK